MRPANILGFAMLSAFLSTKVDAQTALPSIDRALSAVTLSFENDGGMDRAVLALGDNDADLYIFRHDDSQDTIAGAVKLAMVKKSAVWSGAMWGTLPSLEVNAKGSLVVKSANIAIGRSRWEEAMTVVKRGDDYVVIGLTYSSHDTIDLKIGGNCDLNFATGKGARNGKPVSVEARPIKLADWNADDLPKACQF